ncbi:flagellar hook assembly protein FlgD [Hansschlegelia quercus]|uniref:Basal-body rod modification protein FlgD n=1 Tax=Hansschlegelia quercus TaxID=2528245 RepID=A0A4Q9GK33_9HYPH|nr:flagellar hook capping FlgD N-terminal domain-containing protein [Hansschlegelia quercus]TBN53385.1 flagellar hook assembly protein FlgD [Hansschlegelia quercus]
MAIDGTSSLTGSTGSTASAATSSSGTTLANNFETFLTLLTTQLKNQNPLDPLDTNQFTQQLVQFAGVEQQLKTNDTLGSILTATQTSSADTAVGMVGKTIVADGSDATLTDGKGTWTITAPEDDVAATIQIRDSDGDLVATRTATFAKGENDYTWDGVTDDGSLTNSSAYSITVTGKNAAGAGVTMSTDVTGVVDGVDFSTGTVLLTMGDLSISLGDVKKVTTPTSGS